MGCIFCKQNTETSVSVEHIIPESLGNKEHILPKGIVCDRCNNYFANKIERPMLDIPYFISARNRMAVENKKGRVPKDWGMLMSPWGSKVELYHEADKNKGIGVLDEQTFQWLSKQRKFTMIVPMNANPPNENIFISKFLGKVAIEAFAKIGLGLDGGIDDVTHNIGLDPLRNYVRYGNGPKLWPYNMRQLYAEDQRFLDKGVINDFEVLHEYQLFQTSPNIWHLVLIIFGIEFCINLCDPTCLDYDAWLQAHNYDSPLYGDFNNTDTINENH